MSISPPTTDSGPLPRARRLSEELESLLAIGPGQPMQLRTVVEHLQFRGLPTLIVLLCVPFLFPLPLPGLSIPFGVAIALDRDNQRQG